MIGFVTTFPSNSNVAYEVVTLIKFVPVIFRSVEGKSTNTYPGLEETTVGKGLYEKMKVFSTLYSNPLFDMYTFTSPPLANKLADKELAAGVKQVIELAVPKFDSASTM